ncbi:response regulator [Geovibrio thiophilus]|uniref:Response regulator n=1 Tax=Geovibrio thiophilus TaxID=139438 RepID=A0A410K0K8_9BACT|nr:response regulator [Geovibrio thiophilus]QAR33903.1 response regulator [Geovibrio thiophilus]
MSVAPRVIIADDEAHIRLIMKKVIQSINCELVGEAQNGFEAVELCRQFKVDIVLLDINMPKQTGTESIKFIKELQPNSLIIMLTSVADVETVDECLKYGAYNYIRKDTPIKEIRQIIVESWNSFLTARRNKNEDKVQPEGNPSGDQN